MNTAFKWLGRAVSFTAPYPYQDVYPALTAARHIRSLSLFASRDQDTHPGIKKDQSLLLTIYPLRGILIWLVECLVRYVVELCLANLVQPFLVACIVTIILAPVKLVWIRSITSDTPISIEQSIRTLHSVTLKQWIHFISTLLACHVVEELTQLSINRAFGPIAPDPDTMGALSPDEAQRIGRKLMASIMATSTVIRVIWVPETVAIVAAALDLEEKRGMREFYMYIKESVTAMPVSLWVRFGLYFCVATMIRLCLGLFETVSVHFDRPQP